MTGECTTTARAMSVGIVLPSASTDSPNAASEEPRHV